MTAGNEPKPEPVRLLAQPGSHLEELLAHYETAKASADEAKDRLAAITSAIKAELTASAPGATSIRLSATAPGLPRLSLTWVKSWKFDVKQFKEENPLLYVRYGREGGNWTLRQAAE